jgi:antibiotic biosynthesis monooxygenase (ABM) superfamily enzyme
MCRTVNRPDRSGGRSTGRHPTRSRREVIERHITFNVHPDKTGEFVPFFTDQYGPTMAKSPGFVKVELLREVESPTRYQMVFRFEDADSAAGWRTSDVHQALQPALIALFDGNEIQGYEVTA